MQRNVKLAVGVVIAAALVALLWSLRAAPLKVLTGNNASRLEPAPETDPLVIGAVLPLTGPSASFGVPLRRAGELAVKELNAAGGMNGRTLMVLWEDGKCDAREATAAAQKLINIDKVGIIFGGACSNETLAIAPLAQEAGVILISPSASAPEISAAGTYVFRTAPSDAKAGEMAARYAYLELNAKTAGVITENSDYPRSLREAFIKEFRILGGRVALDADLPHPADDLSSLFDRVSAAAPEVLYLLPESGASGVGLVKQLRARATDTPLISSELLINRDLVGEQGKALQGVLGLEVYFDDRATATSAFLSAYAKTYREPPPFPAVMANMHSQFALLRDGITAVGTDPNSLRAWLQQIRGWEGTLGMLTFDENGDAVRDYAVVRVNNSRRETVTVYPAARR
ncbi:MAG: branched-chain amino acid transport system substrate-binding protein [Parcubacteria group bacterium Gr01-1014_31]|nr:MAG: branched-chain amino acid transport system substrate-binding protein [Parcubacteria group bacterium Gr01-1014_31]